MAAEHGAQSIWNNNTNSLKLSFANPPRRLKTAEDFFAEWEQQDKDFQLRYAMDYKLDLTALVRRTEPDHLTLQNVLSAEELRGFRCIQHLTLEQVRRVHRMMQKNT